MTAKIGTDQNPVIHLYTDDQARSRGDACVAPTHQFVKWNDRSRKNHSATKAASAGRGDGMEFGMTQTQTKPVVQFIERLQQTGGLKGIDIANFTGVSRATVSRWTRGQKSPHPKTQLIMSDLSYVVMRLSEYYSQEEVRAWLYARHPQLEGKRAIDLVHGERTEEVIAILDRLDADAYL